ncbi:MAG TPA: NAD-dependent epimerase/dehydratase family protein [Candidatus Wujingus californicus]|uniref:NAD-dependent epimerase/dehydratase family protein n=1 Tax=Candidatus Wujingus californicus TaxID=3367618 RepID=UPI0027140976|nr:NAD-dependent epimerase/dehydratase family protein [Candidatus Brocadiales bacterium]
MITFKNSDKILVVGGSGFLGKHLVRRCLRDTRFVSCIGLGRNKKGFFEDIEVINVDINNKDVLWAILNKKSFDYIFNLGGYIDHTNYFNGGRKVIETHFVGLLNILDCIDVKSLKSFVQIGSSDEYGNAPSPQRETMRENSISPYSQAKVASTHLIQMLHRTEGFPGVVLRFFLVYGPGQDNKRFLPQIINGCLNNIEFKTSEGKQLRDFCYIDDVIEAMIKAAALPQSKGNVINIASGTPVMIKDVIQKVMLFTDGGKPMWGAHPYRVGENMQLYADISLAKNLLHWEPQVSLDVGLKKTIEYYKALDN